MSRVRKTTIVAIILVAASCLFAEKAQAQFFTWGNYGHAGWTSWQGTVPNAHGSGIGFTLSPIELINENGQVTGRYDPNTGLTQGKGFMPPVAVNGFRNGRPVTRLPMARAPKNRRNRRHSS